MNPASSNLRGILAMCLSCLMFTINDMLLKLASAGMTVGQIIAFRGFCVSVILITFLAATGQLGGLRHWRNPRVWFRAGVDLLSVASYLPALIHMPIGNATVIMQLSPVVITAAAALYLREPVGWQRWAAVLIGFAGVVVVARPGFEGFNAWALLILVAVASIAARDLVTRTLPGGIPGLVLILAMSFSAMPVGAALGLFEEWTLPPLLSFGLIMLGSCFLIGAYWFLIIGMRNGEVAVVSTFRYSFVPYAVIVGYLVWDEVPDLPMLAGTALILGAGLYAASYERIRGRGFRMAKPAPASRRAPESRRAP